MSFIQLTPNLMVEDVTSTVDWYERRLGFEQTSELGDQDDLEWAQVERDDVAVMFQRRDSIVSEVPAFADAPVGGSFTLYLRVDDVESLAAGLDDVERVLDLRTSEYGMREFAVEDPNGYVLWFGEVDPDWDGESS